MNIKLSSKEADIVVYSLCRHITELQEQIVEWEQDEVNNRQKIAQHMDRINDCERIINSIHREMKKG